MTAAKHNPLFKPPEPEPFFTRVEWSRATLYQPCRLCGKPGQELCKKFKGAHAFPAEVYCSADAIGICHKLLHDGVLTVVRDNVIRRPA
jgi:hypothetical protein